MINVLPTLHYYALNLGKVYPTRGKYELNLGQHLSPPCKSLPEFRARFTLVGGEMKEKMNKYQFLDNNLNKNYN